MTKGYLVLETGEKFAGDWIGPVDEARGEVVFNTSMTGYQETITDPSYAGQILTLCYPIIGSCGMNKTNNESNKPSVSAVIISDLCDEPSHYESSSTFSEELNMINIPGLKNVDTRALVAAIRKHQTVRGKIVSEEKKGTSNEWSDKNSIDLVSHVSVKEIETYGDGAIHIVLLDFGYKKSLLQALLNKGCKVTIVPFYTSLETVNSLNPDGILISNGPGDPMDLASYLPKIKVLTETYPTLGIAMGHQLIALAYGAKTKKMSIGHRGSNYPVKELLTGKVRMTSQNHGYVVVDESIDQKEFQLLFRNVNDRSLEGMKHIDLPVFSVQFHPEANPGPNDTEYIFGEFIQQVITAGGSKYVEA
ncbi:carbamoyl phosphate synthase small subunit [Virgibacillus sp. C22-A2]|uniref:Carbamoyl phosphate synthase small chain n=1 Tax=Virgibacillus tibetensis TaxID=3042313 RepID=A0ABU6KEL8_9BACI|nr:carbamoyl phosphate synthase small subunit [Virgibacillus sp. C22-A2]